MNSCGLGLGIHVGLACEFMCGIGLWIHVHLVYDTGVSSVYY